MKASIIVTFLLCLSSSIFAFSTAYFEAEHFTSQTGGNKASTEYFPYIGDGYLEMGGQGAAVTWNNITVPKAGKYTLILKYANNTNQNRPCDLKVNGALIKNIPFGPFKKNWEVPWPAVTEYNSETVGWAKYWNARVIVDLNAGANTLELIVTSEEGGPHIDNIGVSTAVSEPPAPVIYVKDHGAVADGSTDNTQAIANAIAACPAGGSVVFDEGIYMTGSITLKANMTLWVPENTVIRAIQDNDKIQTYSEGAFAGESFTKYFLFGNQVDNLTITGGGTIDGNAVDGYLINTKSQRPVLLGFINSKNVTVTNLDLLHSHSWLFIPRESDNVIIDGINIYTPNKDGIDPLDCHNIFITNCVISSGDDAMTPKSYSSKGIDNLVVKNLTINHCKWKGIKFGFSSVGDFTNCLFEDIAMVHVQAGITVLLIDGGNASNLTFNRINMNNVFTPITLLNGGGLRSKAPGVTTMKDINISNLDVRNVWDPMGSFITGTKVGNTIHKVENIYLTNVKVHSFKGGLTEVPGTPIEYDGQRGDVRLFGNFPAWGYYIRHADNVVFNNVTQSVSPEDAREAIVLEDVTGFKTVGPGNPSFSASELTFDSSGRPVTLVLGGVNMLESDISPGFHLRYSNGMEETDTRLSKISRSGDKIRVSDPNGQSSFTFQIEPYDNHLAIHLLDMQGIGTGRNYSLSLVLNSKDIAAYTLNDLMTANFEGKRKKSTEMEIGRKNTVLSWPYLWGRPRPDGTHGSVVLYNDRLGGSARDAVLAEIWSVEGMAGHMVRPAGQATWTKADVMVWVDKWVAKFSRIATVSVDAKNLEDLYKMTDTYVIPSGANRVYMWTNVWRLQDQSMVAVNTNLFPKGKADLIAYSEYLAKHGINLQLKSLSPRIGENDSKYISPTFVDKRIMRTATGELVEDIDPSATTIGFRLGTEYLPTKSDGYMRIGNELIFAKQIKRTDNNVWILEGCERGYGGSTAKFHKAGAEMAGCVYINGSFNFEDDFGMPNSIAEEICGEYGDFLNEVNVGHLHFDGTGRMGQYPWYVRDFTDYIYSRVDHPVTGSRVGGSLPANFEMEFSGAKAISGATAYHLMRIGPRLYERGRIHTELSPSMLDLHFDVSDGIRIGSRQLTFCGGQSGKALSMETLNNYGLTDYAFQLFKYWVELAPVFDDTDADYVAGFLQKAGNHYAGEDVLVLSKNSDRDYIFTPHRVMGRTSGEDSLIHIDQEWGAVPRFQNIKAGTTMELLNPYDAQEPQVVIYVVETSPALKNPIITLKGSGTLSMKGEIQPNEYMKFEGGNAVKVYDSNWNLLRSLPAKTQSFTVNKGNNTVTTAAGRGSDTPDLRVQFITLGPVYVLKSNKHLK